MPTFNGRVLFLDRDDINTDEIIPAKYLSEIEKPALQPHLFEDLVLEGFDPQGDIAGTAAVVTRANFGCGSSREHAPWALEVNGIRLVIGVSFARIFRQNMYNGGMLAVELPADTIDELFTRFAGKDTGVDTDLVANRFRFSSEDDEMTVPFAISVFDRALVDAGGWVDYADAKY